MIRKPQNERSRSAVVTVAASWITIVIGGWVIFRFLRAVLQERFFIFLAGLFGIVLIVNVAFLILWRRRPDLLDRFREKMQRDAEASRRLYGPVARLLFALAGILFAAVAVAGGWVMWKAPDFGLFAALWVLPSTYLAVTTLYIGITGKKEAQADGALFWWLFWPW
ncbi:MAG TPA: hypothetical protein VGK99_12105 [Acidobacteriota bacterium]|jgi:hypothetical protein